MAEKAYMPRGHAMSALHTLTILQVFLTRLLKSLDKEGPDPESLCKLHTATDLVLRVTNKVIHQGVGHSMGSMVVVLDCHLWLTLTEMRDADKS